MATRNRRLPTSGIVAAMMLALFAPGASARDEGFSRVVRAVETTYHTRQNYRFVGWFAGMVVKVARPEGVTHLRMAIFEDQDFSPSADETQLEEAIANALDVEWQPLVRVWSRRNGERTHIYARPSGKDINMFIITLEEREAVVMEVKIRPDKFSEMMNTPSRMGGTLREDCEKKGQRSATEVSAAEPPALQRRGASDSQNP